MSADASTSLEMSTPPSAIYACYASEYQNISDHHLPTGEPVELDSPGKSRDILLITTLSLFITLWLTGSAYAVITNLCRVVHPSDSRIDWECVRIKRGQTLEKLFGDRWIDVARFNRVDRRHVYPWVRIKVPKNLDDIKDFSPMPKTYAPGERDGKFILIDQSEQFLGAYEFGKLVFSAPIASGKKSNKTPVGVFKVTAYDSKHISSLYYVEHTRKLYPMHYGLMFLIRRTVSYWVHGRDVPGYPASHGCVGLYDEEMQKKYYGFPKVPVLEDAKKLFEWSIAPAKDDQGIHMLKDGPKVVVIGEGPQIHRK
jgi:hypothetical protein